MNKPLLSQLLAAFQLAEMAYQADQTDYKRQVRDQAETEYNQALQEADLEPVAAPAPVASQAEKDADFLREVLESRSQLNADNRALAKQNETLKAENSFLKNQHIEKDQKIGELEKSLLSTKTATVAPATVESAPAALEAAPALTPYQKGLQTRQQNLAKAAAEANRPAPDEPQPKKNS